MRRQTGRRRGAMIASLVVGLVVTLAPSSPAAPVAPVVASAAPSAADDEAPASTAAVVRRTRALPEVDLPHPVNGARAVRLLGDQADEAAALNEMTVDGLVGLLREDPTAWLDSGGRLLYKDVAVTGASDGPEPVASAPLNQTFNLHSLPGSSKTIFLDFDGSVMSGTRYHEEFPGMPASFPAWDPAGNGAAFTDGELTSIQYIWASVAEDYAPFDVNVTTADPGAAAMNRSSQSDTQYGSHVLITPSGEASQLICNNACGGVTYGSTFGSLYSGSHATGYGASNGYGYQQPAWVFPHRLGPNAPKYIAEAASHEAGHTLKLNHDGNIPGGDNYDPGHGVWAPIMGNSYRKPVSHWSKGDYANANNQQDDVALMRDQLGLRSDEAGGTVVGAPQLPAGTAYIGARDDVDFYLLGSCTGTVTVTASPLAVQANLDIKLSLVDGSGGVLATAEPATTASSSEDVANGMSASITRTLSGGAYYVVVDGGGNGPWSTDYDDYGSLGAYTMSRTGSCDGAVPSGTPSAPTAASATPHATQGSVALSWAAPASNGGSAVTGYVVTRDGDPTPVQLGPGATGHTWTGLALGTSYTFRITALNARGPSAAATVTATTNNGQLKPTAPQGVSASWQSVLGAGQILYSPPADPGTAAVQYYYFYIDGLQVAYLGAPSGGANLTSDLFTPGVHTIGVSAVSSAGESPVVTVPVTVPARPANDAFAQRTTLSGNAGTVSGDNLESSRETGEPAPPALRTGAGRASLWYSWTAPANGTLTLSTASAVVGRDTTLAVYTGTAVTGLSEVEGSDDVVGKLAVVSPTVVSGRTYAIAVDGYRNAGPTGVGPFDLTWSFTPSGPKATTTSLTLEQNGTSVALSSTVTATSGTPVGYVEYRRDGAYVGYGDVSSVSATSRIELTAQPRGEHTYTATFLPDYPTLFATSSASRTVTITGTPTVTTLQAGVAARTVTLTATVSPPTVAGLVQFFEGDTEVGYGQVSGGTVAVSVASVIPGQHTYRARFTPYDHQQYDQSPFSAPQTVTVEGPPPAMATITSLTGQVTARSATLVATVGSTAGTPPGSVEFTDGGVVVRTVPLTGATATVTLDDLTRGTHQFAARFVPADPSTYAASQSANLPLFVAATPTATDLAVTVDLRTATLRATVTPASAATGGWVTFRKDGAIVGSAWVTDGVADLAVGGLPTGGHGFTADFSPLDPSRVEFSSSPLRMVTVTPTPTSTVLGGAVSDRRVTLTATVTSPLGTPAGTVQFREDDTVVGTASLAGGVATLQLDDQSLGSHDYTATYVPQDPSAHAGSVSATYTATVTPPATATTLAAAVTGRTVTLTAATTAASGTPQGSVEFREGETLLGTVTLSSGAAALVLEDVAPGPHSYTATFVPDGAAHAGSTSAPRAVTVRVDTTTTLSASLDRRTATLTATVTGPGTPSGVVRFHDAGTLVGTATLTSGTATLTLENVLPGTHTYTATFEATDPATYGTSTSAPQLLSVDRVATATALDVQVDGRTVTLTATVTADSGALTGNVVVRDGATTVASAPLVGGSLSRTLSQVAFGPHSYTATFEPTGTVHAASTSAPQDVTVLGSTTTALAAVVTGRTVTLTATVTSDGAPPTGQVTFFRGGAPFSNATVVDGRAELVLTNVVPGDYTYSARFTPATSAHGPSTSADQPVSVVRAASTTTLEAGLEGRTVTLDATVTVAIGSVAGRVQFRDAGAYLGEQTVVDGAARFLVSNALPGGHTYTATFVPNDSVTYAGSVSPERAVAVDRVATATDLAASVSGRTVNLTATVTAGSGTLTGSVEFYEGDELRGTTALVSGRTASVALSSTAPGPHTYRARFVPTGTVHAGSISPERTVTIAAFSTATGLTATADGRTVTLAATVTSGTGTPTGELVLRDGTTEVGRVTAQDGAGSVELRRVAPGPHSYTASFVPESPQTYTASVSPTRTLTVAPIATTTDLVTSYSGGRSLGLEVVVSADGEAPEGTVELRENGQLVGVEDLVEGRATTSLHGVQPGVRRFTATYLPADAVRWAGSVSPERTVTADPFATVTTLVATTEGTGVRLEATPDADTGGEVVFREGDEVVGRAPAARPATVLTLADVAPGAHTYTATLVPADPTTYAGSVSAARTVTVRHRSTTVLTPRVEGRLVTLDAEVTSTSGSAAGDVVFREGDEVLGTVAVTDGHASLPVPGLAPGEHSFRATFVPADGATLLGSGSQLRTVTVDPHATTTALDVTVDGRIASVAVEVGSAGGTPTGTVRLREDGELVESATLVDGAAGFERADLAPGPHRYRATFVPTDAVVFAGSDSVERVATVAPVATATALSVSASGRTVTLQAAVTSEYGVPAGEVEVREGDDVVATVVLSDGEGSDELLGVEPGEHTYTATYVPSAPATHRSSESAPASLTVAAVGSETSLVAAVDGDTVTLAAEVVTEDGRPARGDLVLRDGDDAVGTLETVDGAATLVLDGVEPGAHVYTATFVPADAAVLSGSVSPERRLVVAPVATTTDLRVTVDGRTVTLTADVSAGDREVAGTVVLHEGDLERANVTVEDGVAVHELTGVEPGRHTYTATFVPDDDVVLAGSTSPERSVVVARIASTTDLATSVDVRSVSLVATVAVEDGVVDGVVVLRRGEQVLETLPLSDGTARLDLTDVVPGEHTYTASFVPSHEERYAPSSSPVRTVVVAPIVTTTELTPTFAGDTVTLAVRVTGESGAPRGDVVLREGETVLETLSLEDSEARLQVPALEPGERTFSATFLPADPATYAGSASGDRTVVVGRVATVTELTASVDERAVTLEATVTTARGDLSGEVRFLEDGQVVATETLADGSATTTLRARTPSRYAYTAVFVPDGGLHEGSVSPDRMVEVSDAPVATTTTFETTVRRQSVHVTAAVTSSLGPAHGFMSVYVDGELRTMPYVEEGVATAELRLQPGVYDVGVTFDGDWNTFAPSSAETVRVTVLGTPTRTSLTAVADGDTVRLSAAVTSEAELQGVLEFYEGARLLGSREVPGEDLELVLEGVAGGEHSYSATFVSHGLWVDGSHSASSVVTVAPTPTSTALTTRLLAGRSVELTADVTSGVGTPAGVVTFLDGLEVVGSEQVQSGRARVTVTGLTTGDHQLRATYAPTDAAVHAASASDAETLTMERSATTTTFTATADGPTVAIEATVSSDDGDPTGRVEVLEGDQVVGGGELADGRASLTLTDVAPGQHTYTVVFLGDADFSTSTSAPRTLTVVEAPKAVATATTLTARVVGRTVTLTAEVTTEGDAAVAGHVEFSDGGTVLDRVRLDGGTAEWTRGGVAAGARSWTATFVPDDTLRLLASTSDVVAGVVEPTATTTALTATISGSTATFAVQVSGSDGLVPTGTADLYDGSRLVRSLALDGGTASAVVSGVTVGTHSYRAVYVPDPDFLASTSATRSLSVAAPPAASRTTVSAPKRAKVGSRPVVKVKVLRGSAPAAGKVVLRYGAKSVTLTLRSGVASFKLPKVKAGTLRLTATYRATATTRSSVDTGSIVVKR